MEKEAQAAHVAAQIAEVESRNSALAQIYDEIDGILAATLDVDDYVDLETLRATVEHPPFDRPDLEIPLPPPRPLPEPAEPTLQTPEQPKGVFGKKKKIAELESAARLAFESDHAAWLARMAELPALNQAEVDKHSAAESLRLDAVKVERDRYARECADREREVAEQNAAIDILTASLGYGTVDAVQEYVSIVLSNSVYPDHFEVDYDFTYDPTTAELRLRCLVPNPDTLPDIKAFKYTKASDEITTTSLSQKACKDRYASAVHQVAIRSLHEIFEADRRGLISMISLEVGTDGTDPATGQPLFVNFVAVAAQREAFDEFDLSAVIPAATLAHLGASVSKNPYAFEIANASGIRQA